MPGRLLQVAARAVAAERTRKGWSQAELADRLRWARSTVQRVETGERNITLDELPALCATLGVTLRELLRDAPAAELRKLGL